MTEEFACLGVDDADVEVVDEHHDWLAGVGAADADVAEGDAAGCVDAVASDSVVGSIQRSSGPSLVSLGIIQ